jgi:beta-1,4-N-acetylglucosaminyltransferase
MKVCIAASEGGHLTEALLLKSVFGKYDFFVISYACLRVDALPYRKYTMPTFSRNPFKILAMFWIAFWALVRERPQVVVSTGSEIAIPVFLFAKLFRMKTVFVETITAFENATLTARLLYPLADRFFVQNEESLRAFGPKAEFHGGVV